MFFNKTISINIVKAFPLFAPSSPGSYKQIANLTMSSVNRSIPLLNSLIRTIDEPNQTHVMNVKELFGHNPSNVLNADRLKNYCNSYGTENPLQPICSMRASLEMVVKQNTFSRLAWAPIIQKWYLTWELTGTPALP